MHYLTCCRHLLTGNHVMHNQVAMLARPDIYGQAAKKFLQLLPSSCVTAEKMFLESIRPQSSHAQSSSHPGTPNRVGSPPPPPLLTSSPLHTSQLEKPKAVHLAVPNRANGVSTSTNPFDIPSTPRSRSGSNGSSTGSLVSTSSSVSGGQPPNNHPQTMLTTSSTVGMLQFDYIPPPISYIHNLLAAREAIELCSARCRCWSNTYDQCLEEAGGEREKLDTAKSHEMEDVNVKVDASKPENEEKSLAKLSAFRTRSVTVSSSYRLPIARSKDGSSGVGRNDLKIQGREKEGTQTGSKDIGQALQNLRRSPRLSRRSEDSRFEDKAGLLLKILMDKLSEMLSLPPAINIQLTKLVSRLAHYPQPLLRSLLLNHQLVLRPGVPNLSYVSYFTDPLYIQN